MTYVPDTSILDCCHASPSRLQPECHAIASNEELHYQARADEERIICVEQGRKAGKENVIIGYETTRGEEGKL